MDTIKDFHKIDEEIGNILMLKLGDERPLEHVLILLVHVLDVFFETILGDDREFEHFEEFLIDPAYIDEFREERRGFFEKMRAYEPVDPSRIYVKSDHVSHLYKLPPFDPISNNSSTQFERESEEAAEQEELVEEEKENNEEDEGEQNKEEEEEHQIQTDDSWKIKVSKWIDMIFDEAKENEPISRLLDILPKDNESLESLNEEDYRNWRFDILGNMDLQSGLIESLARLFLLMIVDQYPNPSLDYIFKKLLLKIQRSTQFSQSEENSEGIILNLAESIQLGENNEPLLFQSLNLNNMNGDIRGEIMMKREVRDSQIIDEMRSQILDSLLLSMIYQPTNKIFSSTDEKPNHVKSRSVYLPFTIVHKTKAKDEEIRALWGNSVQNMDTIPFGEREEIKMEDETNHKDLICWRVARVGVRETIKEEDFLKFRFHILKTRLTEKDVFWGDDFPTSLHTHVYYHQIMTFQDLQDHMLTLKDVLVVKKKDRAVKVKNEEIIGWCVVKEDLLVSMRFHLLANEAYRCKYLRTVCDRRVGGLSLWELVNKRYKINRTGNVIEYYREGDDFETKEVISEFDDRPLSSIILDLSKVDTFHEFVIRPRTFQDELNGFVGHKADLDLEQQEDWFHLIGK